ncbi:MAG TPA: hypothetical protein VGD88_16165 [Opitutaceae bacterium]
MAEPHHARIQVRLRELAQLFNSLDPSPYIERDLDENAEAFIVGSARELGLHQPYEIIVHLKVAPDPDRAATLESAVRHFFKERTAFKQRELRLLLRRGRASLAVGIVFLTACLGLSELIGRTWDTALSAILSESLVIGGWVAMWRPLEIFLYDWWPLRDERRVLDALAHAKVRLAPIPAA